MKNKPIKHPMKNITINLPNAYDYAIQSLIRAKIMPSRSEAIRTALRDFLSKELVNFHKYNNMKVSNH